MGTPRAPKPNPDLHAIEQRARNRWKVAGIECAATDALELVRQVRELEAKLERYEMDRPRRGT
jgi:hypothetical protein